MADLEWLIGDKLPPKETLNILDVSPRLIDQKTIMVYNLECSHSRYGMVKVKTTISKQTSELLQIRTVLEYCESGMFSSHSDCYFSYDSNLKGWVNGIGYVTRKALLTKGKL